MSGQHTPGPWSVMNEGDGCLTVCIEQDDERYFERIAENIDGDDPEANARLIAAGPELLKALEALADSVDELCNEMWGGDIPDPVGPHSERARAAIAKATGAA